MVWYAAEPMATASVDRALSLAMESKIPTLLPYTVRRVAALESDEALRALSDHLGRATAQEQRVEILKGLNQLVGGGK